MYGCIHIKKVTFGVIIAIIKALKDWRIRYETKRAIDDRAQAY